MSGKRIPSSPVRRVIPLARISQIPPPIITIPTTRTTPMVRLASPIGNVPRVQSVSSPKITVPTARSDRPASSRVAPTIRPISRVASRSVTRPPIATRPASPSASRSVSPPTVTRPASPSASRSVTRPPTVASISRERIDEDRIRLDEDRVRLEEILLQMRLFNLMPSPSANDRDEFVVLLALLIDKTSPPVPFQSDDYICCICGDEDKEGQLVCGHTICIDCLQQIRDFKCPVCRARMEGKNISKGILRSIDERKTIDLFASHGFKLDEERLRKIKEQSLRRYPKN